MATDGRRRALAGSVIVALVTALTLLGASATAIAAPDPDAPDTTTTSAPKPQPTTTPGHATPKPAASADVQAGEGDAPATDDTGGDTGPPDVTASPLLPSDSLGAAMAELGTLQADAKRLDEDQRRLSDARAANHAGTEAARTELDATRDRRRARMVQAYVESSSGDALDRLLHPSITQDRLLVLATASDRADQRRVKRLEAELDTLTRALREIESKLRANEQERATTASQLEGVASKLAAAAAGIGPAGPLTPADTGPSSIGRLARTADEALVTNDVAVAQAAAAVATARATPTDPAAAAVAADATNEAAVKTAEYAQARARLADAVAEHVSADGPAFDAIWAITPEPALRAMYFALSQVGKPYVYATDGPSTYDCSGLTRRAWEQNGIALPHFSGAQLHVGLPVRPDDLRPGDLLTYGPDGADHVVMYIGAGFDVEAKGRDWGIVVEHADVSGSRFAGASRPMP